MKKVLRVITISLTLAVILSTLSVFAAGKLSEVDFSKWEQVNRLVVDFEDKTPDVNYSEPPAEWRFFHGAGTHSKVIAEGGNKYINFQGVSQFYLYEAIAEEVYVFSVDIHTPTNQNVGIFARAGKERFQYEANKSDFYEHDRTGVTDGFSSLGGSGFYVRPAGNKVKLYIKLYDESQPVKIANALYEFDAGADFSQGFQTVTYIDTGSEVSVFVNDNLIATISFSESRQYSIGQEDYYSKVVIKDAAGTKKGEHDNAIFAVGSTVGYGNRSANVKLDNFSLTTYNVKAVTTPPETEPETPNPETGDSLILVTTALMLTAVLVSVMKKRIQA